MKRLIGPLRLLTLACAALLAGCNWVVLDPKGPVGMQERSLIITATVLMLLVVVPVIVLTLLFAWRYRASNEQAEYRPDWAHSGKIEAVVWLVPVAIVAALGVITWRSSHELDPFRPLASPVKPIRIDAVALNWKWLFIYPDLKIATVNQVAFPANVPVDFHVTSATVMNSFFIPRLGSQIYAMANMETQVHLMASSTGTFQGLSSNFSGDGFSGMTFKALALTPGQFTAWLKKVQASPANLDAAAYQKLARPSEDNPVAYYSAVLPHLFTTVLHQDMSSSGAAAQPMSGMALQRHSGARRPHLLANTRKP